MKFSYILFLGLFIISFTSAVPPVQTSSPNIGLEIQYPQFSYLKVGENYTFFIHTYNITDGLAVDNTTTNCSFHLYNHNGSHIIEDMNVQWNGEEWYYKLDGDLLVQGVFSYIISCNTNTAGGFISAGFYVSGNGILPTSTSGLTNAAIIIIIFGSSILFFWFSKEFNEPAFKIFFMMLSLVFLSASFYASYSILLGELVLHPASSMMFTLSIIVGIILLIIFAYVLIRQTINALDMFNIKRGHSWNVGTGSKVGGYNTKRAY